ncbi:response regulator [Sphingomonas oryzagri]|jgi:DNA-binding NarL/FixJ family response regulator|uniref:Response regulator transcription factor n=1 Tax=Sphingomonas oryzagri TaxID=3042314 RepID=A0ABT6MX60_9SPHN|nr:response regulator transcription factor [Sphingomonas oryzagri]MDH7637393.1 response regulator transcription factor [Sphingomonas oryzagri]
MGERGVERVLIADDHPLVRDGLRTVISVAFDAAELFEAASLDETIAVIEREGDFDLVMLDVNMPGATGVSGLQMLRHRFPALPVVIVSAATDRGLVSAALAAGASGFIPKSLKRGAIVDALKSVLAGEIYVPEDVALDDRAMDEEREIQSRIDQLTPQQRVVLGLIVEGKLNKQIAYELDVSMTTVKAHVSAILTKLRVFSRTQAVILVNKVGFHGDGAKRH